MAYWLFKSEPATWSWADQQAKGTVGEEWGGVRNYQARNNMRAMQLGDQAFSTIRKHKKRLWALSRSARCRINTVKPRIQGGIVLISALSDHWPNLSPLPCAKQIRDWPRWLW